MNMQTLKDFLKALKPKKTPVMTKADRIKIGREMHRQMVTTELDKKEGKK
jgi:hypothetical protein